jgi:hypothetical protein
LEHYNEVLRALEKGIVPLTEVPLSLGEWLTNTAKLATATEINTLLTANELPTGSTTAKNKKLEQLLEHICCENS